MRRRARVALALAVLLASCTTGEGTPTRTPAPPRISAAPSPSALTVASEMAPSPTGGDEPSAPTRLRFGGRIVHPLPPAVRREMRATTWRRGCPVPLTRLSLLRFNYWGFDGEVKRGPMVVNTAAANDILAVFETLFRERFPIRRVALAKRFRPDADPDTRRSVTASFNCRPIVTPDGPGRDFSQHAYGLAVDVNPLQNPYVGADGHVRNRFARPYIDRSQELPGMIRDGDIVLQAFSAIGWAWGGRWSGGRDYMHFSLTGR